MTFTVKATRTLKIPFGICGVFLMIHLIIITLQVRSVDGEFSSLKASQWYKATVNYWPFEDVSNNSTLDYTGSNDGQISGRFHTISGIVGSALALSGENSWVDFGVLPSSCLNEPSTCTSGFTIAFWLKIPEFQSNKIILQLGEHRYSRGFTLWTRKSTTNHKKSIGFSVNTRLRKYMWLQEWNSTDWNHIALKWDNRTRGLSIYVNCSLAQFINQSGAVEPKKDDKASRLILGASHAMKKNIKLLVDEFAIWDRPISDRTLCMLSRVYTVNGNFTEWSSFSACSVTCGNGTMKRIRTCTSPPPKNRGKNCSALGASRETKPCFLTNCPLDGNFSEWSVFSKCSKSCGTGLKRRTRTCSNPVPKHGGRNCSRLGSASEEWECNTHPCPIDGGYSVWTEFTQCDVSCGNGTRQRTRSCSNPKPLHGGRNCSHLGPNVEIGICDTNLCPIHGGFSEWTAFSECTKSCGNGTQRRARKCSNPEPKHGGRNCSSLGPMIEIQQCNVHHCPKNGGYTQWTDFSECTKSCGNGTKIRTRNCTNPEPQYGGKNCSILGKNTEFQQCNTHYCSVNGGYTQWSPFSECTKSCGNGTQIRTRNCSNPEPNYGGNNCSGLGADTDLQFCNTPHCPIDGGYTQWTKFSACSKSCGEGNMTKRRNCTNPKPQYGGNNCSRLGDPVSVQGCNLRPCPVDGNFTEWTKFSKCSRSCGVGLRNRTRYCINPEPMHGGNDCHGKHIEIEVCNILPCPIDGEYTQWSNFSACSKTCDSGIMRRTRSCSNPAPQFGGKHCSVLGYAEEMKTCNDFPCPVDGNYSSWSNYSVCSKSCGNGTMERQRNCSNPAPRHSGNDCSSLGPTKEIKRCNEFPCPIHGNFSAWSIFSVCSKSCGNGTKTRTRNCSNPFPKHRGRNCSLLGPLKEVRSCNVFSCPVHGNYSSWSNFSICSKSCGNGSQTRFRSCTNPKPQHNGNNCSSLGSAIDVRVCNVFPCPVDGGYTEWGNFTHCTKSCGIGAMYRTRNCSNPAPQYGGKNCSSIGPAVEETTCNEHPCPIHGGYTPWSEFSHCSKTCGEGTKQRTRNCSNPLPQFGGSNCSRLGMPIDLEECYLAPCPIDGGYNEWSQFSQCTRSCGGGKQKRWRRCNNPTPKHGGKGCTRLGHASQIQPCHSFPCPIHGNYSEWSGFESCTRTCGGGKRIRRRNCTSPPPAHGGRNCSGLGPSTDSSECNNQSCPDIVFEIAVNLTSEKWHDRLAASDNEDRAHLIQVIQIGVQKIMGYKAVSGVNNFQFKKGSVIAEFSVSLFHSQYQGITKLQDALYVDGKIKNLRVAPVNFTSVDVPVMPPLNITATNTSSTTILLKWNPIPLNYSNGPILEYRITFTEVQKSVHEENQDLWQRIVDGNKLSAFVTGLKKYTRYYFRMGGINRRGVGLDSMPITATTDEDVPSQSPLDVFASNRSSTSVYVQWSPIPEQFIHGILLGYRINFTYLDPAGSGHVMAGVHATGASNTSILIHGLLKFTNYSAQVSGFTVKGDGLLSNQVTVRTDEDVPSRPPANVTGYNITSTRIRVQWEQIPTRYVHGILLGYKVSFIATDCGNQRPWNETTVSPSTTSAVITNLRKYTKYMVSVEGFTIKGSGLHSKCVAITTAEDKPDAYPANVTGFNKSSTSLFVEWQEIPPKHRKGILLGYKISYAPKPSYQPLETVTVDSTRSAVTLVNLKKYTWYNIRVAGFTIKGLGPYPPQTLEIRTSEDVPSKPAISVRARNTSHTSLLVEWNEIPRGYIHGVLLGYRVLFWRFNESRDTHEKIVTGPDVHHVRLTDLWIYTKYKIQVLGFTAAGSGSVSKEKVVSTDEFTPSQPPVNVKALNKTSPTKITVQWNPIPDNFYVHGILRGYKVLYKAIAIANEKLEGELPTKDVIVSPSTLSTVLENLDAFTRYEIEVLAFTIKGYGVKSKAITAETCNCHSTLYTNWWINLPYVDYPGSNKTGIITPILKQAVQACCGNCTEHGNSHIDFQNTDVGEPAMKSGLLEFKRNFEETTELHFPVYGFMDQTRYSNNYGFVPFVQSPGLALIIIGDEKGTAASLLLRSLAFCFPILFLCITMLWVSSLAMWFVETASNERHFPHNVLPGSWEAMWWAFASMTTLGYGDRIPKTPFGRLLGLSWILMGVVMITCFNSTMTTLLTTRILDKEIMLYGTKIAAIQNSTGYRLAIRKNARVNPNGKEYANLQEVYEALQNREVKGMLIDAFTVGSKKELFNRRDLRISKLLDHSAAYGAALGGEAKKLQKCLQKYVGEQRSEISKIVQQNVDTIKITPESLSVERSSGLFDPQFPTYVNTMIACGVLLAVMWMVGAKFEFAKKMGWINLRMKAKAEKALPRRIELMRNKAELKLEMSRIVSIFRINCSRRIQTLREKHKRELLHLARLKRQAESVVIQKGSFRRDSFFTLTFGAIKTQDQSNSERNGHTKQNSSHRAESESEIETMV